MLSKSAMHMLGGGILYHHYLTFGYTRESWEVLKYGCLEFLFHFGEGYLSCHYELFVTKEEEEG